MKFFALIAACSLTAGCSTIGNPLPTNWGVEEGKIWCNVRYLDMVKGLQPPTFTAPRYDTKDEVTVYDVALRGYPYALAAALALQDGGGGKHAFVGEPLLQRTSPAELKGPQPAGFYAVTFLRATDDIKKPEVIVAFSGTNDKRDSFRHNLSFRPEQFAHARRYVKEAAARYPERKRLVVAGYSLGGGLAAHVTQHPGTSEYIKEAWLFNPSPRDGVKTKDDHRIWMAAVSGEILNLIRNGAVGAPKSQRSKRFNLVNSSSIHRHYRWVLTRQMLHMADLTEFVRSERTLETTAALEVLKKSDSSQCTPTYSSMIEAERRIYEAEHAQH